MSSTEVPDEVPSPSGGGETAEQFTRSAAAIGHQPLATIGGLAIQRHSKKMRKRLRRVAKGEVDETGEAVHQLRVTTRSLRASLEMLAETPVFDSLQLHELHRRLGRLARALGAVRDLDVLLARAVDDEHEHPATVAGSALLRETLTTRRVVASTRLLDELQRKRTRHLLRDLRQLARHSPTQGADETGEQRIVLARHIVGSLIWRRFEEVLAFETTLPNASWETLHALRKACKRLRYTLEVLEDAEIDADQGVVGLLRAAQDHLGRLHDLVVALQAVNELRAAHPVDTTIAAYAELLTHDRDQLRGAFAPLWERLRGEGTRQQLANFLAAL